MEVMLLLPAHGEWLASHVPGRIVKVEDGGHLGLDSEAEIPENVRWLRDGVAAEGAYSRSERRP